MKKANNTIQAPFKLKIESFFWLVCLFPLLTPVKHKKDNDARHTHTNYYCILSLYKPPYLKSSLLQISTISDPSALICFAIICRFIGFTAFNEKKKCKFYML